MANCAHLALPLALLYSAHGENEALQPLNRRRPGADELRAKA